MKNTSYDVIVLGLGGMGSAACFELAHRGHRVLGLEQFSLAHDRGSSHGHTRIIRTAYFEHPKYVPLVREAFDRWYHMEQIAGKHLLTQCPCVTIGKPEGPLISGVSEAARLHHLAVETLGASELQYRFRVFHFSDEYIGLLESEGGFLYVEECVRTYIDQAIRFGATIHAEEAVKRWWVERSTVYVETTLDTYSAGGLVITAGPWATQMLGSLGTNLRIMRQTLFWMRTTNDRLFQRNRFPIYIAEVPEGNFYGLPAIDHHGHKVAQHYGAPEIDSVEKIDRVITDADREPVLGFLRRHLPAATLGVSKEQSCIYTLSPDRHFIVDRHPEHPEVALAVGFSGHGFKFASVIGEILADLVEQKQPQLDIDLFRIARLTNRTHGDSPERCII